MVDGQRNLQKLLLMLRGSLPFVSLGNFGFLHSGLTVPNIHSNDDFELLGQVGDTQSTQNWGQIVTDNTVADPVGAYRVRLGPTQGDDGGSTYPLTQQGESASDVGWQHP